MSTTPEEPQEDKNPAPDDPQGDVHSGGSVARFVVGPWSEPVKARTLGVTVELTQADMTAAASGVFVPPRPLPPVVSSYLQLRRTTFLIDFYHSGDPEEQYQVRMVSAHRPGGSDEWEELDHDLDALLIEAVMRMTDWMERRD